MDNVTPASEGVSTFKLNLGFKLLTLTKDTTIKSGGDYTINGGAINIGTNDLLFSGKIAVGANGATFNVYGAYKTPYALLSNNASVSASNYLVSTDISNWIGDSVSRSGGDILAITPNTTTFTTFDTTTAKVVDTNTLSAWSNSTFSHNSSNYIPSIVIVQFN
jgi:hypothetical protein